MKTRAFELNLILSLRLIIRCQMHGERAYTIPWLRNERHAQYKQSFAPCLTKLHTQLWVAIERGLSSNFALLS